MEWFRWYEGSTSDPKFLVVARRCGRPAAFVLAVWAMLLERASSTMPRGSITGFDCESADVLLGMEDGTAEAVLEAMRAKGLVEGERIAAWDKRQSRGDGTSSTERVRAYRRRQAAQQDDAPGHETHETHETACNAMKRDETHETPREDKRREEKKKTECVFSACACAREKPRPLAPPVSGPAFVPEREASPAPVSVPEPEPAPERRPPLPAARRQPDMGFEQFFDAYPVARRGGRREAEDEWTALVGTGALPGLSRLLDALARWEDSQAWKQGGGRFVPTAANFLKREYWLRTPPEEGDGVGDGPRPMGAALQRMMAREELAKMILADRAAERARLAERAA